jgi:hypothetical protein
MLGIVAAFSQSPSRSSPLSDASVTEYVRLALARLEGAKCTNDQFCTPATPAEIANPPIELAEARAIIERGYDERYGSSL